MEHLAEIKLKLIAKIAETNDEQLLKHMENLLDKVTTYISNSDNDTTLEEPALEYKTEQDEREMLLNYIEHPIIAERLRISLEQAAEGKLRDSDKVHNDTIKWLNSL